MKIQKSFKYKNKLEQGETDKKKHFINIAEKGRGKNYLQWNKDIESKKYENTRKSYCMGRKKKTE